MEMQDQGRGFLGGEELIGGKYVCLRVRGMQVGTETMNWRWPQLVLPWVFSSFSQPHGVRSREGGLWDDPMLGFCHVEGAAGQGVR